MRRSLSLSAAVIALVLCPAGSASATPRLYAPVYFTEPPATKVFDLGADGSLTELSGSPFATVAGPAPYPLNGTSGLAFAPDGTHAIAAFFFDGGIQGLSVGPGGGVSPVGAPIAGSSFSGFALSPDGRFAYLSNGLAGGIRAYSVAADGSVATLGGGPFGSGEARDLAMTPDGRYLYASNTTELKRFSIAADGTPSPAGTTMTSGPSFLIASPDGRFLFAGNQGSGAGVTSFSIGNDGSLTQNGEPALTGDTALEYFAVAADGAHLYMPDSNLDKIVVASVAADGKLTVIGSTPALNVESVMPSADGRFLYWATRQNKGHIDSMSIGADGIPVPLPGTQPWESGEPERLVLHPEPVPVASFAARPAAPGAESRFDANGSSRVVRYDWAFGDGTTLANGGATPRHRYAKAGVYDVKLTVTDAQGCSARQVYTGQSTVCPGGGAATKTVKLDTLPAITALSVSRKRFATASAGAAAASGKKSKVGTVFRYKLTEAAKVKFKIERRKGKKFKQAGPPLNAKGKKGKNKLRFSGKLRHKTLPPGSYRATAVAIDSSRGRSAPRSVSFRIIGG
jgi:hypothetical protein